MACSDGGIIQSVGVLGALDGLIQEGVGPGRAGFLVVDLLAQGRVGLQAGQADVVAVLADHILNGVDVEIVQLNGGDLMVADNQSRGHTGGNAGNGGLQGYAGHQRHTQGQDDPEGDSIDLQFLCFFSRSLLLLGHSGSDLLLAELLLAGCTHGNHFLSFICCWVIRQ